MFNYIFQITGEVPLPGADQQAAATAPLFAQNLSPLQSANSAAAAAAAAAAMTRYGSRTSQNPRRSGRRPREEYVRSLIFCLSTVFESILFGLITGY